MKVFRQRGHIRSSVHVPPLFAEIEASQSFARLGVALATGIVEISMIVDPWCVTIAPASSSDTDDQAVPMKRREILNNDIKML